MIYFCITTVSRDQAPALARRLVDERLAACVNIVDSVRSIYRWQGEVHDQVESLLYIKTSPRTLSGFENRFRELHPYETPELIMIPIEDGLKEYLNWVAEATTGSPGERSAEPGGSE